MSDWVAYCESLISRQKATSGPTIVSVMAGLNTSRGGRTRAVLSRHRALERDFTAVTVVLLPQVKFDRELSLAHDKDLIRKDGTFIPMVPLIFAAILKYSRFNFRLRRCPKSAGKPYHILDPDAWMLASGHNLPDALHPYNFSDSEIRIRTANWRELTWWQLRSSSVRAQTDLFQHPASGYQIIIHRPAESGYLANETECFLISRNGHTIESGSYGAVTARILARTFGRDAIFISDVSDTDQLIIEASEESGSPSICQLHGRSLGRLQSNRSFVAAVFPTRQQHKVAAKSSVLNPTPKHLVHIPHYLVQNRATPVEQVSLESRKVVYLGRLDSNKQVAHIIQAISILVDKGENPFLDIYGHGPKEKALGKLIAELELESRVKLRGFTHEPLRALAEARVSVVSSRREGFALSLFESLSMGTPVVAYDFKYGPRDAIADGSNGRLVPQGNIAALAEALSEILALDDAKYRRMSDESIRSVASLSEDRFRLLWDSLISEIFPNEVKRRRS